MNNFWVGRNVSVNEILILNNVTSTMFLNDHFKIYEINLFKLLSNILEEKNTWDKAENRRRVFKLILRENIN